MLRTGGKETRKVIGPLGNSCPKPRPASARRPVNAGAIRTARRAIIVRFLLTLARLYPQSARRVGSGVARRAGIDAIAACRHSKQATFCPPHAALRFTDIMPPG